MKDDIERIYHNASRISTVDRAKRYAGDIETLYQTIKIQEDRIRELEDLLKDRSVDVNAVISVKKIVDILDAGGHLPKYSGPR